MNLKIFILITVLAWFSTCDSILLILDNTQLTQTHSKMITMLKSSHTVQIAYSFGKTKIQLKTYDRFKYDHVIVMSLSAKCMLYVYFVQNLPVRLKLMILFLILMKEVMLSLLGILILIDLLGNCSMLSVLSSMSM